MNKPNYKEIAIKLWGMLDDIDTYSDMAKSDEKLYRNLVERKQRQRFELITSDGYDLFINGEQITDDGSPFPYGEVVRDPDSRGLVTIDLKTGEPTD